MKITLNNIHCPYCGNTKSVEIYEQGDNYVKFECEVCAIIVITSVIRDLDEEVL